MKRIVGVELSHQKAPLAVREKISLTTEDVKQALVALHKDLDEVFIVSTCNRLAVYALGGEIKPVLDFFRQFGELDPYLAIYDQDTAAIRHLYATASGLESQAIGEHEILGQIKKAYALALEMNTVGAVMDEFIRRAIYTGKKVRKETAIGQYPVSLASVSYDQIRVIHRDFTRLNVLVLGTGEMSTLILKILSKKQLKSLTIASRTSSRAESLAHMYSGRAIELDQISGILPEVDVVIGATHTQDFVLKRQQLEGYSPDNQLTLIDLGLPRNFDPEIKNLPGIKLFDLDDMKSMTSLGIQKRQEEVPKAMDIVESEMAELVYWLNTRQVSPLISSYYERLEQIRQDELKWVLPKLGQLDEAQQKIVENLISRVTRRVSGKPIERLKEFSQEPHLSKNPIDTFKELFDL